VDGRLRGHDDGVAVPVAQIPKSFLLLFFKKEVLP
jgi:hypothetical protein